MYIGWPKVGQSALQSVPSICARPSAVDWAPMGRPRGRTSFFVSPPFPLFTEATELPIAIPLKVPWDVTFHTGTGGVAFWHALMMQTSLHDI